MGIGITSLVAGALNLAKTFHYLMPADVFEDVGIALLLEDATIVDIYVEFPVVGQAVNLQRRVLGVLRQETELLIEFASYGLR